MDFAFGFSQRAGFVSIASWVGRYFSRRRRIRAVTRVVHAYSLRHHPELKPAWSFLAEDRPHECVVYLTYRPEGNPAWTNVHRFFLVRLPELEVIPLKEDYTPARWGPFQ